MKTITVRQAQHNLAEILREVEAGEVIEILRRKSPVARVVPVGHPAGENTPVDWTGHEDLMASVWRGASLARMDEMLDDLRGGRRP